MSLIAHKFQEETTSIDHSVNTPSGYIEVTDLDKISRSLNREVSCGSSYGNLLSMRVLLKDTGFFLRRMKAI